MRKPHFAYAKTKTQITAKLISAFVFATRIVQSLYFLNPKEGRALSPLFGSQKSKVTLQHNLRIVLLIDE